MYWKNQLKGNRFKKKYKKLIIDLKLPHMNKTLLARMQLFVSTRFSHSALELEGKMLAAKHPLFALLPDSTRPSSIMTSKTNIICEK